MSRYRLNTALVVGAMINGLVEKNVDDDKAPVMRPTNMQPHPGGTKMVTVKRGCRSAQCRTLDKCMCDCKRCFQQCAIRK